MGIRGGTHRWAVALVIGLVTVTSACSGGGGSSSNDAPSGTDATAADGGGGGGAASATQPAQEDVASTDNAWCKALVDVITAAGFEPVDDGKLPTQPEPGGCYWSESSMIIYRAPAEGDIDKYLKDNSLLAPLIEIDGLGDSKGFQNRLYNAHWVYQGQYYTMVLCSNLVDDCDSKTTAAAQAVDKALKGS